MQSESVNYIGKKFLNNTMEEFFPFHKELEERIVPEIDVGVEPTVSNYEDMVQEILFLDNQP
jgi:hypothetical protein